MLSMQNLVGHLGPTEWRVVFTVAHRGRAARGVVHGGVTLILGGVSFFKYEINKNNCIEINVFCFPTGVRGIRTIRVANVIDAQPERGAAERPVLRRLPEHRGSEVHPGPVRHLFQSLPEGIPVSSVPRRTL